MKQYCYFCGREIIPLTGQDPPALESTGQVHVLDKVKTCGYKTISNVKDDNAKNYYVIGKESGICVCSECIGRGIVLPPQEFQKGE